MPIAQGVYPKPSLLQVLLAWPSACVHSKLCPIGLLNIGLEMPFYVLCCQNTVILAFNVELIYILVQYLTLFLRDILINLPSHYSS